MWHSISFRLLSKRFFLLNATRNGYNMCACCVLTGNCLPSKSQSTWTCIYCDRQNLTTTRTKKQQQQSRILHYVHRKVFVLFAWLQESRTLSYYWNNDSKSQSVGWCLFLVFHVFFPLLWSSFRLRMFIYYFATHSIWFFRSFISKFDQWPKKTR